jgi:peptide-methionine (S)-S-oxide reductase
VGVNGGEESLIVARNRNRHLLRQTTLLLAAVIGCMSGASASAAEKQETAVLAGGCFWGVESVYEHVKGVRSVVSGYAGGTRNMLDRSGGRTGFAEAVRISFNPDEISYNRLLEIFFTIAHDPTQVDRQGPDVGPQYRSAVFPQNAQQQQAAEAFLGRLRASGKYSRPIATRVEHGRFEPAEQAHQDYVRKHPSSRYVVVNDLPKLADLRRTYPQLWRD